jgi:hypothetical protein
MFSNYCMDVDRWTNMVKLIHPFFKLSVVVIFVYESFLDFTNMFTNIISSNYIVVAVCQYLLRRVSRDGEQDVHILTESDKFWLCHTLGGYSLSSHHSSWESIPDQVIWDLWCTKWYWNGFSLRYQSPLPVLTPPTAPHSLSSSLILYIVDIQSVIKNF